MNNHLVRCPACVSHRTTCPIGYVPSRIPALPKRCEVCKGLGLATNTQVMGWEMSL